MFLLGLSCGKLICGKLKNGVSFKKDIASLLDSVVSDDVYSVDDESSDSDLCKIDSFSI